MQTFSYSCSACDKVHPLYESCADYLQQFFKWLGDTWLSPMPDKLVILPDPDKSSVSAGAMKLHLPDKYQDTPSMGTVIACGENVKSVVVGERVLYGKYAGLNYETGNLFHLKLVRTDEIICRLQQQENTKIRKSLIARAKTGIESAA